MLRRMSLAILFNLIFIASAYSIDITEINAGRVGQEFLDVEQLTIKSKFFSNKNLDSVISSFDDNHNPDKISVFI